MTVRALAERLGTVWGRGAAVRGEGGPQPGMSPGPLSQDQPFTHPPPAPRFLAQLCLCHHHAVRPGLVTCLLSYLPDCKVRGMHTLGAPPAEESRDRIQLQFTLGLDIQGRPPPPASSPLSLTQPPPCSQTQKSVSSAASSRHQPTRVSSSFCWERPPPPRLLPPGSPPHPPP